jgi:hypothetical protein
MMNPGVAPELWKPVSFSVPTGNFGDILAGYYAKRMGLPIVDLVVATNENDILHRFFSKGQYHKAPNVTHTLAPSMDICVSSNFERFLFHMLDDDPKVSLLAIHNTLKVFVTFANASFCHLLFLVVLVLLWIKHKLMCIARLRRFGLHFNLQVPGTFSRRFTTPLLETCY